MAPKTILITGCSEGGLGDALARAFSSRGHHVIATARNPSKMKHFEALNIQTLSLDVLSSDSIEPCVSNVAACTNGSLDILINNSGAGYSMPLIDVSIPEARRLFELNVWSMLAVTRAFLPLLLKSHQGGMIVNNTSIVSVLPNPMAGIYNASKAAAAMLTDTLRLELAPFNIKVVDLKTGAVKTNFFSNLTGGAEPVLPKDSIYMPAREAIEKSMRGEAVAGDMVSAKKWAEQVVADLLAPKPPLRVWRGGNAWLIWFVRRFMPFNFIDGNLEKMGGLDVLKAALAQRKV
jgi:1-acylglycerone phosphate reductase